jgi:hypothetical protein
VEAISPDTGHADSSDDQLPAYPGGSARSQEDAAELAAAGGALVTAVVAQRWNEANRTWLQRRIGASPARQTREEVTVRAGALLGGTLAYLLVTGATQGLRRLQDRNGQHEVARSICRILRVAATAPDGSMPEEASFIVESALISMGVSARTRKRLLAEPRPASVSDLGACPLPEPLLSAVAVIAFAAMAEAASPEDAVRQMPALLRRMGLARPTADTKAGEILDEYTSTYLVLSDLSAELRTEAPQRPFRIRLPVAAMMAVGEAINARNTNELNRQVTRQAMATLLRRGIRATVSSGVPLHPAASTVIRVVGKFLDEELPALPAQSATKTAGPLLVAAGAVDLVEEGLAVEVPAEVVGEQLPEGLGHVRVPAGRDVRCQQDLR